ncbi:serine/threonine protein kinase with FHA domain (plasmid) [Stanieria cyanosphaera PCC 7437]|uniref:Serine/threonine protein kinase with FHA domain n=1 Tax=Stanieria cyanosphaera (strain ATCC 29371 / PCC 7437) TaxID=111780 RepID=K9Y2K5_STAC7|nr:protein kinase [Stanieria cyanosphaera]AFZ38252.1 serine/threonine protein kinase with FHA domain [Stanieria cyanosphaera PCC 7437]
MPSKVTLKLAEGKLNQKQFTFDSRTACIIGRAEDCNIQIPNDKHHSRISRYHCLLDINPPEIRIRDFGSRNGTIVNGECIGKREENQTPEEAAKLNLREHDLQDGDRIQLDRTVFVVAIESESKVSPICSPTFHIPLVADVPSQIKFNLDDNLGSLKGYTKIKLLGKGGFGEVYLARKDVTGELVALKLMLPQVAVMPTMKERFLREARNTKLLNHPNLVKLEDYCFTDGIFFFTMEFCDRGSVIDLMKKRGGKLSTEEATDIILQVLDGLHYAHTEKGIVHRDIKPGNIFLTVEERKLVAKLGDYGLAKAFDLAGLSGLSITGKEMGTPKFMPRQQVLDFKYSQPDVDVWAVAATLYCMLTLECPRNFEGIEPWFAILTRQPIPIRKRDASIPKPLAELIDLALMDKSELHFKSAIAFKNALLSVI